MYVVVNGSFCSFSPLIHRSKGQVNDPKIMTMKKKKYNARFPPVGNFFVFKLFLCLFQPINRYPVVLKIEFIFLDLYKTSLIYKYVLYESFMNR